MLIPRAPSQEQQWRYRMGIEPTKGTNSQNLSHNSVLSFMVTRLFLLGTPEESEIVLS
jgi:hypothetical protein